MLEVLNVDVVLADQTAQRARISLIGACRPADISVVVA
jgi:hypothetical protein